MNKAEIREIYSKSSYYDFYHSPEEPHSYVLTTSGVRITGYASEDGIFYFAEYLGGLPIRNWQAFFEGRYAVESIDYIYTKDGMRIGLIGLRPIGDEKPRLVSEEEEE